MKRKIALAKSLDCLFLSALCFGLMASLTVQLAPKDGRATVAVVFPPWISGGEAVRRAASAGATIVRMGSLPFIVIVNPTEADFGSTVGKVGGWLLLDAGKIAGCVSFSGRRQ